MDPIDLLLLERYIVLDCTSDERARVERWLTADPSHRALLDAIHAGRAQRAAQDRFDADAALTKVKRRRGFDRDRGPSLVRPSPWRVASLARGALAAAAVVLLAVGLWRVYAPGARGRMYATTAGERATIALADGTRIILAPDSRLRLDAHFDRGRRDMQLEGEAFFSVAHDAQHPLAVHTKNVDAQDVGTRFVVRSYAGETTVQIGVLEGAVSVRTGAPASPRQLAVPGSVASVSARGIISMTTGVDTTRFAGWTNGQLVFDAAPLGDIASELGRWYDLDVRVNDRELGEQRLTASFRDQPIDAVCRSIAATLGVTYARHGRVITFFPGRP